MKIGERIGCPAFPCTDIDKKAYVLPPADIDPDKIRVLMITEAPPNDIKDYFYAPGSPFYLQTVLQAFRDAGAAVSSMADILDLGVYITTAIKCGKTSYAVSPDTMQNCAALLEGEMAVFPNVRVFMLMGDVAIKMANGIWKKRAGGRVIPAGSTYKVRGQPYHFDGKRVLPSYTPAGQNFLIEKSKRRMVAEDIREALRLAVG
jgi:uracil-DNA glycosylase